MALTVIIGEDKEKTSEQIAHNIRKNVEDTQTEEVSYIQDGGAVRPDREVAEKMADLATRANANRISFVIDQTVEGNDYYGFDVIWELSQILRPGTPASDFLLDRNFLVVIITHYDNKTTVDHLVRRWNNKLPGTIKEGDVEIIKLRSSDDVDTVLNARRNAVKVLPIVLKSVHTSTLWDLLRKWSTA
ncbi:MAG: hypothetical protein QGG42_12115 [Phycisphaerae bacterium]|jgi:hypothetical protein|nr:hypothetical protein [Phycisphaerae bacterium]